jgi:hypothetical protein
MAGCEDSVTNNGTSQKQKFFIEIANPIMVNNIMTLMLSLEMYC